MLLSEDINNDLAYCRLYWCARVCIVYCMYSVCVNIWIWTCLRVNISYQSLAENRYIKTTTVAPQAVRTRVWTTRFRFFAKLYAKIYFPFLRKFVKHLFVVKIINLWNFARIFPFQLYSGLWCIFPYMKTIPVVARAVGDL